MGADVRQIARLLQAKAPEGHMLAYITPDEAKLLKSQGGSGKEHADTGIPSFAPEYGDSYGFTEDTAFDYGPEPPPSYSTPVRTSPYISPTSNLDLPSVKDTGNFSGRSSSGYYDSANNRPSAYAQPGAFSTLGQVNQQETAPTYFTGGSPAAYTKYPVDLGGVPVDIRDVPAQPFDTAPSKTIGERYDDLAKSLGMKPETLSRLGLAGGLAALGSYQSKKAREQAEEAKKEQQKLAEPYRAKGAELQRAAQSGELTPVGQQQLQAVQAQAAQQASGRGGAVSAAQTQAQIEAFRAQLLQQQYDYGLKLSGIGDNIALGAIKTGLEADRYVQQLSNNFYTNMANIAGGMPAQAQAQQRTA